MRAIVILLSFLFSVSAFGQTTMGEYYKIHGKPWYIEEAKPETLKVALAADRRFLGEDNAGFRMQGGKEVCAALRQVKLPCDYNTRITLSLFLTVNGKGLFPASGGTNPYFSVHGQLLGGPDDYFIGQPKQNAMLAAAVRRNVKLFVDGDITTEAVQERWK